MVVEGQQADEHGEVAVERERRGRADDRREGGEGERGDERQQAAGPHRRALAQRSQQVARGLQQTHAPAPAQPGLDLRGDAEPDERQQQDAGCLRQRDAPRRTRPRSGGDKGQEWRQRSSPRRRDPAPRLVRLDAIKVGAGPVTVELSAVHRFTADAARRQMNSRSSTRSTEICPKRHVDRAQVSM
ncbi:hypothetical protein OV079_35405 [Nannocystis pusilla]|uniref:Uncharacterized protein n=1 Tax=Nannocystis pusilla TaxID=889268 RepID=A0A9X3EV72_9BACT|nr:hypothetical protein [Nannocystis pusilla]MCY1010762.1 hypothetical protein [Nannocystis pusilla]